MAKINLNDLSSLTNEQSALSSINNNYATIETEADKFLSRDGESPNQMEADLDMNSNNILNLPFPAGLLEPARAQEISDYATFSTSAPSTSLLEGSLWIDTNDGTLYELRSSVWTDTGIVLNAGGGGGGGGGGSGDVTGPASSTDNAVARFDGTGGKTLQNSGVIVSDTNAITGVDSITVGNTGLVVGASTPFSDSAGTLTLQNVDALDATTESTIEAAIDTLANLTSVQSRTVTLADPNLDVLFGWDDSGSAYKNFALADLTTEAAPATGDFLVIYGAEGDVRKANWSTLPGAGGGIANVVEDTTPQLGGDLDANTFDIQFDDATGIRDDSDNEQLIFQKTASAVNHIEITNAATGGDPSLTAAGDDTDIDLVLAGKGAGGVISTFTNTGVHILDTNASHDLIIVPGSDLTADRNLTLTTGDAARTVTIGGNTTISQDYSTTGNPQFATIELGAATDTTLSRSSAGVLAVEGVTVSLNSTSATHTAGTIELGAASDTTLSRAAAGSLAVEGVTVATASNTLTLSNKTLDLPQINDTSDDHQYVFAVSELAADRTVTLPLLTGDDTFTFNAHTATLTNKTIDLTSNTLVGSVSEFNTALESADFVTIPAGGTLGADPNADRVIFWDDSAGSLAYGAPTNGLEFSTTNFQLTQNSRYRTITFIIDGGGSAITTGVKGYLEIPFACTIDRVTMLADQSGSIVVDIWKDTYANYPPVDADSITASAVPTITTATKSQDATLTGWTTSITAGDILGFNVDSATTVTKVTISLRVSVNT